MSGGCKDRICSSQRATLAASAAARLSFAWTAILRAILWPPGGRGGHPSGSTGGVSGGHTEKPWCQYSLTATGLGRAPIVSCICYRHWLPSLAIVFRGPCASKQLSHVPKGPWNYKRKEQGDLEKRGLSRGTWISLTVKQYDYVTPRTLISFLWNKTGWSLKGPSKCEIL